MPGLVELESVIDAIEARLVADATLALTFVDRLIQPEGTPKRLAHQGVWITLGSTANLGERRQRHESRMEDSITVGLSYRINPHDQRASRRAAVALETSIRQQMTHYPWSAPLGFVIAYEGTTSRGVDGEYYLIEQDFSIDRLGGLGEEL